jgi:hypothetical protein
MLSLANAIAGIVREKQLMDAGEAKATAKALAEISGRLAIGNEVTAAIESLTDSELDEALRGE